MQWINAVSRIFTFCKHNERNKSRKTCRKTDWKRTHRKTVNFHFKHQNLYVFDIAAIHSRPRWEYRRRRQQWMTMIMQYVVHCTHKRSDPAFFFLPATRPNRLIVTPLCMKRRIYVQYIGCCAEHQQMISLIPMLIACIVVYRNAVWKCSYAYEHIVLWYPASDVVSPGENKTRTFGLMICVIDAAFNLPSQHIRVMMSWWVAAAAAPSRCLKIRREINPAMNIQI